MAPWAHAYSMASCRKGVAPLCEMLVVCPPMLRFTTRAPWSTTQWMPAATSSSYPLPLESSDFATTSLASGATEATPNRLLVRAAAIPLTWVPWPWSSWPSWGWPVVHLRSSPPVPMQVAAAATLPARSSWARSAPVSTTPMSTPAPVLVAHAAGALMTGRPHCWANPGSLAAPAAPDAPPAPADVATNSAAVTAPGTQKRRPRTAPWSHGQGAAPARLGGPRIPRWD